MYSFINSLQSRTERRLEERIREHLPNNLMSTNYSQKKSSISEHIYNTLHPPNQKDSFSIIFKARDRRTLKFIEAVAISIFKPELNVQQSTDYNLKLPWS